MSSVVMFLSNAFSPDLRVMREARALLEQGHQVTVICWDRQASLPARERVRDIEVVRVQDVRSSYGAGWRQLFYLPRFWQRALRLAREIQPDVVHCHDLDTLYPGWILKRSSRCALVYDAHENYPGMMSLYLPNVLVQALSLWERWLMAHADSIITASTVLRDEFAGHVSMPVVSLGNYQDLAPYEAVADTKVAQVRERLSIPEGAVAIGYVGGFSRNRMLVPFIEAASTVPDVQFHLWGDGAQRAAVEEAVARQPNAHYHGWLDSAELPAVFKAMDLIYYCLRPDYSGAEYNAPNTLCQAMAAGRPIIANEVGDLGRIVRETRCGMLIDEVTLEAISRALGTLRDARLRAELGGNGLDAARTVYNTDAIKARLGELYAALPNRRAAGPPGA